MRLSRKFGGGSGVVLLVGSVLLCVCSVFVSGLPQWVWNPDADTGPKNSIGSGNRLIFGGQIASDDKEKVKIKLDDTEARLFLPSLVSAIAGGSRPGNNRPIMQTTSRPSSSGSSSSGGGGGGNSGSSQGSSNGGGGSGSSGGQGEGNVGGGGGGDGNGPCNTGACIGGSIASQAIDQGINAGTSVVENNSIFSNILQNIFGGGASTLPANIGNIGGGNSGGGGNGGAQCTCEDRSQGCFLPAREVGSCDSGTRIRCCTSSRGSRTVFPDEDTSFTSTNSVKTVTRSEIRRALLKNIVRGSGSIIDDTLDLLLHPFLNREDQVKVATRVFGDS